MDTVDGTSRRSPQRSPQQPWPRRSEREQLAARQREQPAARQPAPEPRKPWRPVRSSVDEPTRPVPPRRPVRPREPEPETRPVPRTAVPRPVTELRQTGRRDTGQAPRDLTHNPSRDAGGRRTGDRESGSRAGSGTDRGATGGDTTARVAAVAPTRTRARGGPRRGRREPRSLASALLVTAAATAAPGSGHLILRRRRAGALILGAFLLVLAALAALVLGSRATDLLGTLLSTKVLIVGAIGLLVAAAAWITVIIRTYVLARPRGLDPGRQAVGGVVVTALCLVVAGPFGFAANLANSQRDLLDTLFSGGGGTSAAEAFTQPRLNLLLVGSDAGPDRTGARTDTMMVASIDTVTGRTTLFGLPRNIGYAQFPPGSRMAEKFPSGFHDSAEPTSGNYLLNAVYAWGHEHPADAPPTPTADPGLNLLHQTVSYMLGLKLDYYVEVNMAGFASLIDALGGLTVDVGPNPVPIGGILPSGRRVAPDGYVPAGVQQLTGEQALAFARSRTDSTDYARMGRQRCLIQNILDQKSPADLLTNFQGVAKATTNSVSTNIPQEYLPKLVSLAGGGDDGVGSLDLESVSFDPNLPDPQESDGRFDTGRPNFPYMREVVQNAINGTRAAAPGTVPTTSAAPTTGRGTTSAAPTTGRGTLSTVEPSPDAAAASSAPTSVAESCA